MLLWIGLGALGSPAAHAELSEAEWRAASSGLSRLIKTPGAQRAKRERIALLARDDSARAASALVDWALATHKLRRGALLRDVLAAEKRLAQHRAKLKRRYKGASTGWKPRDTDALAKRERALAAAQAAWSVEAEVDRHLAAGLAGMGADAWDWIFTEGGAALQAARYDGAIYRALLEAAGRHASPASRVAVLALMRGPAPPAARIRALDWAVDAKPTGAFEAALGALRDPVVGVRRGAVRVLKSLDDPRAVEALVAAIGEADGLLAHELDQLLFWFTGLSLEADAAAWGRWWEANREGWRAKARHAGPTRRTRPEDATFYGITSPSKRIVFLIDQSGSMQKPARGLDALTGEPRPGGSRMRAALDELRRAIDALASDVRFNLVFYSDGITAYKPPPVLVPATRENKAAVGRWLDGIEAEGTTALFDALHKALAYADGFQGEAAYADPGVDTVFLLTDGSPTDRDGNDLSLREIDGALLRFLVANEVHHVVVNTVGVGRGHNRLLMERIANKTGGSYVSVVKE